MTGEPENTGLDFKIGQIGIVVKDLEKASSFLQKIGIGPFEIVDVETKTGKLKVGMFQQEKRLFPVQDLPVADFQRDIRQHAVNNSGLPDKGYPAPPVHNRPL